MHEKKEAIRRLLISGSLFLIATASSFAQSANKIDSLNAVLEKRSGIERYEPLVELGLQYFYLNDEKCFEPLRQAADIALSAGDSGKLVSSMRMRGEIARRLGDLNQAMAVLPPALATARRNSFRTEEKYLLNSLALVYTAQANYDQALKLNFESLLLREQEGNIAEVSTSHNNIGLVYFKLKNYLKANEYFSKSLELKRQVNNSHDLDRVYINNGLALNQLNRFEEAEANFKEAFRLCGENCRKEIIVEGELGLGLSKYHQEELPSAMNHLKRSLKMAVELEYDQFIVEGLTSIARIHAHNASYAQADSALHAAERLAAEHGYNESLISIYKELSGIYNRSSDFKNASLYQSKYIQLKDSIYSETLIDNLAKVQTEYQERENIATIAAKNEVIQRQRSLNFAIVIIAILASLLIFVLYRSNRVKKKVNQALSDAKAIIEDQNRQLLSSNYNLDRELKEKNVELQKANESLLRVNDELDNFIYKTSHDIRGPLASLKGMCNVALMDVKDELALSYLQKLDITAEKLNTILTRLLIVNQINNSALGFEKIDFEEIVNDVLALEKKKGLPPRLRITAYVQPGIEFFSDREFVRIIFENLIDNAIKFYNDSDRVEPFVSISVMEEGEHVKIRVVDNGIGISEVHPDKIFQMFSRASERSETGGIGLYITKTAAEKLGGSIYLETSVKGQTEFSVKLPLVQSRVYM